MGKRIATAFFCVLFIFTSNYMVFPQEALTNDNIDLDTSDYSTARRVGMGVGNMFFGLGSIFSGQKSGWWVTGLEIPGIIFMYVGFSTGEQQVKTYVDPNRGQQYSTEKITIHNSKTKRIFAIMGLGLTSTAVLIGYLIPFAFHKDYYTRTVQNNIPLDFEFVSPDPETNGVRISYKMKF